MQNCLALKSLKNFNFNNMNFKNTHWRKTLIVDKFAFPETTFCFTIGNNYTKIKKLNVEKLLFETFLPSLFSSVVKKSVLFCIWPSCAIHFSFSCFLEDIVE